MSIMSTKFSESKLSHWKGMHVKHIWANWWSYRYVHIVTICEQYILPRLVRKCINWIWLHLPSLPHACKNDASNHKRLHRLLLHFNVVYPNKFQSLWCFPLYVKYISMYENVRFCNIWIFKVVQHVWANLLVKIYEN